MQISRAAALVLALAVTAPVAAIAGDTGSHADKQGKQDKQDKREARRARLSKLPPEQREALRARVQEKIQTYLVVELTSKAGLDQKKSVQLSTAVKAHLERMETARDDKRQAIEALQGLIEQKAPDAALLAQIKVVGASGDREAQQQQLVTDVAKFLTPTEQAKLIVALPEVMKDAMRLVREARKDRE